jgi:hypothetical protein
LQVHLNRHVDSRKNDSQIGQSVRQFDACEMKAIMCTHVREQPSSRGLLFCTSELPSLHLSHVAGEHFNMTWIPWLFSFLFLNAFWHGGHVNSSIVKR